MLKRCFDFCVALMLLCLTAPVLVIIAALIRCNMGAPVLFRQERPGLHGRPFMLYKFRSMTNALTRHDGALPSDEARLTPLGKWLRSSSLDELPQLWNVVKGDMSLVGPRPLLMEYLPLYNPRQARRHEVRPGITGWTQVMGRNALSWPEKLELDVWYIGHVSFALDMKIIGLTVVNLLRPRGISRPGSATTPKFTGTANDE